jgi:hypothetical protein
MQNQTQSLVLTLLALPLASTGLAQFTETKINGVPWGDPTTTNDWNITSDTGALLFRTGAPSGPINGFSGAVLGQQTGAAATRASVGGLQAVVSRSVTRTANQAGINNTTTLQANAFASFNDLITFSGSGGSFSVTFTPDAAWATLGLVGDVGGLTPLTTQESGFSFVRAEVYLNIAVRNANGSFGANVSMSSYEEATSLGLNTTLTRNGLPSADPFTPVTFNLFSGQSLVISGYTNSTVRVFSSIASGPGGADAFSDLDLFITDLTEGWTYSTGSGATLEATAIPEPASASLLAGAALLAAISLRRRARR